MNGTGSSHLAAWVLVALLILGIAFFNIVNPPAELQNSVQEGLGNPIPVVGMPTDAPVPSLTPTLIAPNATQIALVYEATATSISATQVEVSRLAAQTEIEATRQVVEATLVAQSTLIAIRQSEVDVLSTQVANETIRKKAELHNQQQLAILRVSVFLGIALACGLFLIVIVGVFRLLR